MDDQPNQPGDPAGSPDSSRPGGAADESFGWPAEGPDANAKGEGGAGATAERMVSQLQSMIDALATQAAPVVRQVGAKAAELAAAAADRAGPIAHKAADATADASVKIAERSRTIAADLRRASDGGTDGGSEIVGGPTGTTSPVLDGVDDASEQSAKDDPAEGMP